MRNAFVLLMLSVALSGCIPTFWRKPPPPSFTGADGRPLRESWCYQTLGAIDCYDRPQDVPAGRFIGVHPPILSPDNLQEYGKALAESR